jgi:hypothetical protein
MFGGWCGCAQYNAPGFLKNTRQHRQFGLAAIEIAQVSMLAAPDAPAVVLSFGVSVRTTHSP